MGCGSRVLQVYAGGPGDERGALCKLQKVRTSGELRDYLV
jgi:hypothetical protein